MQRLKILASSIPLVLAAVFARGEWMPTDRPCVTIGDTSVQLATSSWQAHMHVAFTDDPTRATIRVQIVETPETADLAIADDVDGLAEDSCGATVATRMIGITADASAGAPLVYLSHEPEADYRIYVRSRSLTPRDVAALIVGASGKHPRMAAAAL